MVALRVIGWVYVAIAVIAIFAGAAEEAFGPVALGVGAVIAGVLILALDRVVTLLADIRDRLPAPPTAMPETTKLADSTTTPEELQRKIDKARQAQAIAERAARGQSR